MFYAYEKPYENEKTLCRSDPLTDYTISNKAFNIVYNILYDIEYNREEVLIIRSETLDFINGDVSQILPL